MKKQGFTLIELMVVVVIIGILAAVAVPKLFGMIAKSKASEVGPAAGTYVKLQQAYFSESNAYGGWTLIGYTAPAGGSSNNFTYAGTGLAADQTTKAETEKAWSATNNVKLNDCAPGENWTVKLAEVNADDPEDSYDAVVAGGANCTALTPTFANIGK
jgi:prepilin-type N-terminal cleavage/methylation domain-containing protein